MSEVIVVSDSLLSYVISTHLQDAGIWYLFHKIATGDSHSLGIETKSELTPLGIFYNNRVHSNFKVMYNLRKNIDGLHLYLFCTRICLLKF